MDISWEDAQTFLAVAENRSFSGAARALALGQPTVSRRIALLEERVGCQLFYRDKRGADLTADGARLIPAAEEMARWAAEFERRLSGAEESPSGTVRLASAPGLAVEFLAPFAALAAQRLPDIRFEIKASVEHVDLSRGAADLAIRTRLPSEPELVALHGAEAGIGVFASPAYAERFPGKRTLDELDWVTWDATMRHVDPRPFLEEAIPGFTPVFASDDFLVQKAAVRSGLGAMILDRSHHPIAVESGLAEIEVDQEFPAIPFYVVCAKSMQFVPRVRAVADLLIELFLEVEGARRVEVPRANPV